MLQLVEIFVASLLLSRRWRLPVVFQELLKASAVDHHHSGEVDTFRFQLPERVQAPIIIAFYICEVVTRLPTALCCQHGREHDLARIRNACIIVDNIRPATLSRPQCTGSRYHEQEHLKAGFSHDKHFVLNEEENRKSESLHRLPHRAVKRLSGKERLGAMTSLLKSCFGESRRTHAALIQCFSHAAAADHENARNAHL